MKFSHRFLLLLILCTLTLHQGLPRAPFGIDPAFADDATSASQSEGNDDDEDAENDNQSTQKTHSAPGDYRFDASALLSGGLMAGAGSVSLTGYDKATAIGLEARAGFRFVPWLSVGAFYHAQGSFAFGLLTNSVGLASVQQFGGDVSFLLGPVFRVGIQVGYFWAVSLASSSLILTRTDGLVVSPRVGFEVPVDDRGVFSFLGELSPQLHTGTSTVPLFLIFNAQAGVAIHFK